MCPTPSSDTSRSTLGRRVRSGLGRGAIVAAYVMGLVLLLLDIRERYRLDYGRDSAFVPFVDGAALAVLLAAPLITARRTRSTWRAVAVGAVMGWILVVLWMSWVHCQWGSWDERCYPWSSYLSPL